MLFHRPPVPARDGLAVLVEHGLGAIAGEHGVAALDVVEVLDDGLGRGDAAAGAEVPLEVADPQDQLGDGGGARVHLEAEELVRIDGEAGHFQRGLLVAEPVEGVEDFAFEALEVLQGDVEEIAGAAGGVEDARLRRGGGGSAALRRRLPSCLPWRSRVTAAALAASHSARSGSTTVGMTRRST